MPVLTPELFAIKDAMDLSIKEVGATDPMMIVKYLNSCSFAKESETVYAKKKGANAIAFSSGATGTFTMGAELVPIQWLAMALGGEFDEATEEVVVKSISPSTVYEISGTFRCTLENGKNKIRSITFPKAKPQPNTEITFEAENVASFEMTFDLMVDENDVLMKIGLPEAEGGETFNVKAEDVEKVIISD